MFDPAKFSEVEFVGRDVELTVYFKGHSQLLLRAPRHSLSVREAFPTRIDVLFQGVTFIKLPTAMRGLKIALANADAAQAIESEIGGPVPFGYAAFVLTGANYSGFVVAAGVAISEDTIESSYAPSALTKDFEIRSTPEPADSAGAQPPPSV